jgi:hypothetical protein
MELYSARRTLTHFARLCASCASAAGRTRASLAHTAPGEVPLRWVEHRVDASWGRGGAPEEVRAGCCCYQGAWRSTVLPCMGRDSRWHQLWQERLCVR